MAATTLLPISNVSNVRVLNTRNFSGGNRSGFFHESQYVVSWDDQYGNYDGESFKQRVQYYNRTWEKYPFDTSRKCTLSKAMAWREGELKECFLQMNNVSRLSAKRKPIFVEKRDADPVYAALKDAYAEIGK